MNILYFIGNGFDINNGLKTDFKDILHFYINQDTDNTVINSFKNTIKKDGIINWANFEEKMGLYTDQIDTKETPVESFLEFSDCIIDFKKCIIKYLKDEENKVNYTDKKNIAKVFLYSIFKFTKHLGIDPILVDKHIEDDVIKFSYINFNFTTVFDKCLEILKQENIFQLEKRIKKGFFNFTKLNDLGTVEHIHGTLNDNIILGVNDLKQIKNIRFHNLERIHSYIKPIANDKLENNKNARVLKLINEADIFCIFGMSLGKTDKKWWVEIVKQMNNNPQKKIVIYAYDNNYNGVLIEETLETKELYKTIFLNHLKFTKFNDEETTNKLKQNIHVVINTDIFNLKLL